MPIEANMKYIVGVTSAQTTKSKEGTLGLHVVFTCDEGSIEDTLWCTEGAKEKTKKSLTAMGVPVAVLSTAEFWRNPFPVLKNSKAQIVTEEDSYNGKTRVRVKWINSPHYAQAAPPEAADTLAAMFDDDGPNW